MKIGFIGLGIMGTRMAANLQKNGYELVVYNRTREKADPLISKGALRANTPAEVGEKTTILFTMLARPDAVSRMALGEGGFLASIPKDSLWVDCSTVNPSFSRQMAEEAKKRQIRFLDAPVSGSKGPAERGELIFFVGGSKADVDVVKPLLDVMGKTVIHVGGHGMGASMKMVNNLMLAQAMVAFSEAMVLGVSLGISKSMLFSTLLGSPVAAPFLSFKKQKIEEEKFEAEFPLRWMHKDMQLAADSAYEAGVALPAANVVKEVYALAVRSGLGEMDFSAVYGLLSSVQKP